MFGMPELKGEATIAVEWATATTGWGSCGLSRAILHQSQGRILIPVPCSLHVLGQDTEPCFDASGSYIGV